MTRAGRRKTGQPAGYVLLAVLLLTALIASLVMTYSRHALLAADSSAASYATQRAQDAADTGVAWAKQSLRDGGGSLARMDLGDGRSLAVSVASPTATTRSIDIAAHTEGTSQALHATFELYSTTGDELPALTAAAKTAVPAASPITVLSGNRTYTSTELTGILYLRNGTSLILQDVILDGAIVTENAVTGASSGGGVDIEFRGGVQIQPGSVLPGIAIVAPNAELSGNGTERIEIHGAVIVDEIDLDGSGAIHGPIASNEAPELSSSVDRPGYGRAPQAWPTSLETGSASIGRLAFRASDPTQAERDAIRGYRFPTRRGGHGQPGP